MILACNFEEATALGFGARSLLEDDPTATGSVAAPTALRGAVERVLACRTGDVSIQTLSEQREMERGLEAVVTYLRDTLDASVLLSHPAAEEAVAAYFDYAHALTVLGRTRQMGREMRVLVEVMTGAPPTPELVRDFVFPD